MKKPVIVAATLALLAAPATAFALTSSPALPTTFSLSSAGGVANCTKLPYVTTAKNDVLVQITISSAGVKIKSLRAHDVPAGKHVIRWCGKDNTGAYVAPGQFTWHVQTRHLAGQVGLSPATPDRVDTVIA